MLLKLANYISVYQHMPLLFNNKTFSMVSVVVTLAQTLLILFLSSLLIRLNIFYINEKLFLFI